MTSGSVFRPGRADVWCFVDDTLFLLMSSNVNVFVATDRLAVVWLPSFCVYSVRSVLYL